MPAPSMISATSFQARDLPPPGMGWRARAGRGSYATQELRSTGPGFTNSMFDLRCSSHRLHASQARKNDDATGEHLARDPHRERERGREVGAGRWGRRVHNGGGHSMAATMRYCVILLIIVFFTKSSCSAPHSNSTWCGALFMAIQFSFFFLYLIMSCFASVYGSSNCPREYGWKHFMLYPYKV
jgi:hypothetical protein